jgi:hypothetical protein
LPNATLAGFATKSPCVAPVPVRAILRLGLLPFDEIVTVPLAAPLPVGAKFTVNVVLWPAFKVSGRVRPVILNAAPLADAAEIVRLDPPELVNVSDKFEVLPTWTVPNPRDVGFGVRVPCVTPVPERGILRLGLPPFEVMLILPVATPLVVGAKVTVNEAVWPAVKVTGRVRPDKVNPAPVAAAAEIVRLVPPELVRVSLTDFVLLI